MKKTLKVSLAMTVLSSILLSGCGSGTDSEGKGGTNKKDDEKVVINLKHTFIGEGEGIKGDVIEDFVKRYMNDHSNVEIKIERINHEVYKNNKLKADLTAGNPPDIFWNWGFGYAKPFVDAGYLMETTELFKDSNYGQNFLEGSLDLFKYDGKIYGIPVSGVAEGIFYNEEIFKELNLNVPKTWDEFMNVVKVTKEAGYIPMTLGNKDRWNSTLLQNYFYDRVAGTQVFNDILAGKASFVNDDYRKANEYITQFLKADPFPKGFTTLSASEAAALMYQKKAAMYLSGSWEAAGMYSSQAPEGFGDKVGFFNFPSIPNGKGDSSVLIGGPNTGWSLSAKLEGKKKEVAIDLAKWLSGPEFLKEFVEQGKVIPFVKVDVDQDKAGLLFKKIIAVVGQSKVVAPYNDLMDPKLAEVYYGASQEQFAQFIDGDKALQKLQDGLK